MEARNLQTSQTADRCFDYSHKFEGINLLKQPRFLQRRMMDVP